jgi:hypothetical protein
MSTIGKLAVAVLGNIDDFKKNFGEAKKGVTDFSKTVQKTDLDLKKVGRSMTLIGTAIVGGLTAVTVATAKSAEEIDLLSKTTGASREELQSLGYAAKQEGATLEKLATGLTRLSRNMFDAKMGTGEAKDAFKALNINIKDSNGNLRSSSDVLNDIADRFKSMKNDTERSALAMKLFGRSGAELVPFLKQGSEEIARLKKEAVDLGHVIDEDTIIQMEQLGDELEAVRTGFAGIGRQIAADAAPALLNASRGAKEFFIWIHQIPPDVREFVTQGALMSGVALLIAGGLATLITKIGALRVGLAALNLSFAPFLIGAAIFVGLTAIVSLFAQIKENARLAQMEISKTMNMNDLLNESRRLEKEIAKKEQEIWNETHPTIAKKVMDKLTGKGNAFRPDWSGLEALRKRQKEVNERIKELSKTESPDNQSIFNPNYNIKGKTKLELELERITKAGEETTAALERLKQAEEEIAEMESTSLSEAMDKVTENAAEYEEGLRKIAEAEQEILSMEATSWQKGINESTKGFEDWSQHVQNIAATTAQGMSNSISDFLVDAIHGDLKNLEDYFQSFLDSILRAWTNAMAQMATQRILSGLFPMPSTGAAGAAMPARAGGGPVTSGVSYLVGERGPELFTPSSSGNITPNNALGGVTIKSVNVINNTGVQASAETKTQVDPDGMVLNIFLNAMEGNKGGINDRIAAAARG